MSCGCADWLSYGLWFCNFERKPVKDVQYKFNRQVLMNKVSEKKTNIYQRKDIFLWCKFAMRRRFNRIKKMHFLSLTSIQQFSRFFDPHNNINHPHTMYYVNIYFLLHHIYHMPSTLCHPLITQLPTFSYKHLAKHIRRKLHLTISLLHFVFFQHSLCLIYWNIIFKASHFQHRRQEKWQSHTPTEGERGHISRWAPPPTTRGGKGRP